MSKALAMSIVAMRVLSAGFLLLKPSKMSCVMLVRRVVVEWLARKPCCEASSGMCSLTLSNTRRSRSLESVQSSEMGR